MCVLMFVRKGYKCIYIEGFTFVDMVASNEIVNNNIR